MAISALYQPKDVIYGTVTGKSQKGVYLRTSDGFTCFSHVDLSVGSEVLMTIHKIYEDSKIIHTFVDTVINYGGCFDS